MYLCIFLFTGLCLEPCKHWLESYATHNLFWYSIKPQVLDMYVTPGDLE